MAYGQIPTACGSACGDMEAYLSKYANLCVSASTSDQMECIGSLCAPAFMATAPPCLSCLDDSAASTGAALKALIDQLAPACAQAGFPVE
jgi:hypothetical protein